MTQGESASQQVGHFFGINNAPARVRRSEFQNFVAQGGDTGWTSRVKTQQEAEQRAAVRNAAAGIRAGQAPNFDGMSASDREKAINNAQTLLPESYFKYLSGPDKVKAYELATPEERQRYNLQRHLQDLDLEKSAPFKRMPPDQQRALTLRLYAARSGQ